MPELGEEFILNLTSVVSISDDVGEGVIDSLAGISQISVPDSDFPHRIVCFHTSSISVSVEESSTSVNLTLIRIFGSIGELMVAENLSLSTVCFL